MEENKEEKLEEQSVITEVDDIIGDTQEIETLGNTGAVLDKPIEETPGTDEVKIEEPTPVVEEPVVEPLAETPAEAPVETPAVETPAEPAPAETPAEPAPEVQPEAPVAETGAAEEKKEEPKKKSKLPLILLLLIILAAGGFAVWYFVLGGNGAKKEQKKDDNTTTTTTQSSKKASPYRISSNNLEEFDLQFLRVEDKKENIIYSPLSIKYALAMLNEGTQGDSHEQIKDLIGDYKGKKYTNSENLSIANAFFIRESIKDSINDSYKQQLLNKYGAETITDPFTDPYTVNSWVKEKTLGLIDGILDKIGDEDLFYLVNALGIDMEWKNYFLPDKNTKNPGVYKTHTSYESMSYGWAAAEEVKPKDFDGVQDKIAGLEVVASFNNYDVLKDKGEEAYKKQLKDWYTSCYQQEGTEISSEEIDKVVDDKIKSINSNKGKEDMTTDFLMYVDDDVKVFAKDLDEYDGTTLQYVGIMPINKDLNTFVKDIKADDLKGYIKKLKELKKENFKDGYITEIKGYIPKFKYDYSLDLEKDLKTLGVTNIFSAGKADLSKIAGFKPLYINKALHMANIEFTQYGIKAAAATLVGGAGNATAGCNYTEKDYKLETIDITFNKPYLYIIRDKDSGEVWFTGEVYNPLEWAKDPDYNPSLN